MLQFIAEESILKSGTKIVLHYLIRSHEEALFLERISQLKQQYGDTFEGHVWLTRKISTSSSPPFSDSNLIVHKETTSTSDEVGQPCQWWERFTEDALEHFGTEYSKKTSLVYICGPQGLTDKLLISYEARNKHIDNGHVQVEKWW